MSETLKSKFERYRATAYQAHADLAQYINLAKAAKEPDYAMIWLDKAAMELEQLNACIEQMEFLKSEDRST